MRITLFFILTLSAAAQPRYDLLLKGGHLIDPKNGVSAIRDVAISQGTISAIAENIPASQAARTIDISSLYVTPGLVDCPHLGGVKPSPLGDGFS